MLNLWSCFENQNSYQLNYTGGEMQKIFMLTIMTLFINQVWATDTTWVKTGDISDYVEIYIPEEKADRIIGYDEIDTIPLKIVPVNGYSLPANLSATSGFFATSEVMISDTLSNINLIIGSDFILHDNQLPMGVNELIITAEYQGQILGNANLSVEVTEIVYFADTLIEAYNYGENCYFVGDLTDYGTSYFNNDTVEVSTNWYTLEFLGDYSNRNAFWTIQNISTEIVSSRGYFATDDCFINQRESVYGHVATQNEYGGLTIHFTLPEGEYGIGIYSSYGNSFSHSGYRLLDNNGAVIINNPYVDFSFGRWSFRDTIADFNYMPITSENIIRPSLTFDWGDRQRFTVTADNLPTVIDTLILSNNTSFTHTVQAVDTLNRERVYIRAYSDSTQLYRSLASAPVSVELPCEFKTINSNCPIDSGFVIIDTVTDYMYAVSGRSLYCYDNEIDSDSLIWRHWNLFDDSINSVDISGNGDTYVATHNGAYCYNGSEWEELTGLNGMEVHYMKFTVNSDSVIAIVEGYTPYLYQEPFWVAVPSLEIFEREQNGEINFGRDLRVVNGFQRTVGTYSHEDGIIKHFTAVGNGGTSIINSKYNNVFEQSPSAFINGGSAHFSVSYPEQTNICFYSLSGRLLYSSHFSGNQAGLPVLSPGLYLMQITDSQFPLVMKVSF